MSVKSGCCCNAPPADAPRLAARGWSATRYKCGAGQFEDNYLSVYKHMESCGDGWCVYNYTPQDDGNCKVTTACSPDDRCNPNDSNGNPKPNYSQPDPVFNDEDTTEDLKARTAAAPEMTGKPNNNGGSWFTSQPGGGAFLSKDELWYSICKTQTCVVHSPVGTCYLKVWMRDIKTDNDGYGGVTTTTEDDAVGPYEWSGEGDPCISNPSHGYNWSDKGTADAHGNEIWGDWDDIPVEDVEAGQTIATKRVIRKWSFVPDYEPDDPIGANSLERPNPDKKPNGFPADPDPAS